MTRDRVVGMFLGVAIGDALYMPAENLPIEERAKKHGRITTYVRPDGHKWFDGREAGTWTDDTQLTLAVAESLIAQRSFDVWNLAENHVQSWKKDGDLGFGPTTRTAIKKLASGVHWTGSGISDNPKHGLGNAMPMKVSPLGAYKASPFFNRWSYNEVLFDQSLRDLTIMTHYKNMAIESAFAQVEAIRFCLRWDVNNKYISNYFLLRILGTMKTVPKVDIESEDSLATRFEELFRIPFDIAIDTDFIEKFGGGTSYVYNSLPFSYAFFLRDPFSIEALYSVGNAGGDTDTNASIVGSLLGALNGVSIFPQHLIDGLWQKERILATANRFYETFFTEESQKT